MSTRARQALGLVRALGAGVTFYKVGLQLFMEGGLQIVNELVALGKKVFLDLKIDDTPRTSARSRQECGDRRRRAVHLAGQCRHGRCGQAGPRRSVLTEIPAGHLAVELESCRLERASACAGQISGADRSGRVRAASHRADTGLGLRWCDRLGLIGGQAAQQIFPSC
jgi:hypothetical protein